MNENPLYQLLYIVNSIFEWAKMCINGCTNIECMNRCLKFGLLGDGLNWQSSSSVNDRSDSFIFNLNVKQLYKWTFGSINGYFWE